MIVHGWRRFVRHLRFGAVAYAVLAISILFALLCYFYVRQGIEAQNEERFQEAVLVSERALERRTTAYVDALVASRAFLAASENVRSEEWEAYISGLDLDDRYQGFESLGYVRYLDSAEEVEEADLTDTSNVPLRGPSGGESVLAPVEFVGPSNFVSRELLGYDLFLEEEHREAMEAARDSGEPRATSRVYVLGENDSPDGAALTLRPGFFVYLPVYADGPEEDTNNTGPATPVERREEIEGFVFGSFRMDGLLSGLTGEEVRPALDFEVYDGEGTDTARLLYDGDGVVRASEETFDPRYSHRSQTSVAGRDWSLYFATLPSFDLVSGSASLPNLALAFGLAVAVALFVATWLLSASREKAEEASVKLEEANRNLEVANRELEAFSYSVSHDLRAPLRSISGFSQILAEDYEEVLDREGVMYLERVRGASHRMSELIDDLLLLSRVTRAPIERSSVAPTAVAREVVSELEARDPEREVLWRLAETPKTNCDRRLLRVVLENLLGNAWKFTSQEERATVEFGSEERDGVPAYYVRDNGAGFDGRYAGKLFGAFQRLHTAEEFEGTGIGLATVARIVRRHGGEVWAEGEVGEGATFHFTMEPPKRPRRTEGS